MKREERQLLASVLRNLRERFPFQSMPYVVDELARVSFDADGITIKRRRSAADYFPDWADRFTFRSVTEGVDLAVALGLLPVEFSSAYRAADDKWIAIHDAFYVNGDDYTYLDCGDCEKHVAPIDAGEALVDLVTSAVKHRASCRAAKAGGAS